MSESVSEKGLSQAGLNYRIGIENFDKKIDPMTIKAHLGYLKDKHNFFNILQDQESCTASINIGFI